MVTFFYSQLVFSGLACSELCMECCSVFYISHDEQYMIKTVRKEEIKLLLNMLPKYVEHVRKHPATMLLRFFGVHRVRPSQGLKVSSTFSPLKYEGCCKMILIRHSLPSLHA